MSEGEFLFDVLTPLGFSVHVTRTYWELIVNIKHPAMAGRQDDVGETLSDPDVVRVSKSDPNVYLFYKAERKGRWVCVVAKVAEAEEGFVITAYLTDAIKEGKEIWHR